MRIFFKFFFRTLRIILGPFMLLWEMLSAPKGVRRPPEEQQKVDEATATMALYQFKTCPFCIKVRQTLRELSLNISTRDARNDPLSRKQLLEGGGQVKVPCLRFTDAEGNEAWMYESNDIIHYLRERFGQH